MAPILPGHGEKQDAPEEEGKTPHEEVERVDKDDDPREKEGRLDKDERAVDEVTGAEASEADPAESSKWALFHLLGLVGFKFTSSHVQILLTVAAIAFALCIQIIFADCLLSKYCYQFILHMTKQTMI